ncbi:hypothetical protein D9M68_959730 [compost metagenome]
MAGSPRSGRSVVSASASCCARPRPDTHTGKPVGSIAAAASAACRVSAALAGTSVAP